MPQDSPYRCGWWYRTEFAAPAAPQNERHSGCTLAASTTAPKSGSTATRSPTRQQVAGAYRTYDFDVTGLLKPGKRNVLAVETFAPTEKDLGINWVDWNPCPPDKDMGLWGAVNLVSTGAVTVRSPMAVTHFPDSTLASADLTVYAELHNATDHAGEGRGLRRRLPESASNSRSNWRRMKTANRRLHAGAVSAAAHSQSQALVAVPDGRAAS